jgi:hypothetical protein
MLAQSDYLVIAKELAMLDGYDNTSYKSLAQRFGISFAVVCAFADEYKDQVETLRDGLKTGNVVAVGFEPSAATPVESAPLRLEDNWIANKAERLDWYRKVVERLWEEAGNVLEVPTAKVITATIRNAAEELGQLPVRAPSAPQSTEAVGYVLEVPEGVL